LITDGTFESGQGAWGGFNATGIGVSTAQAHSGTQSLTGAMASNGALSRDIKSLVTGGAKYTATAWAMVSAAGTPIKFQNIRNCDADASDSYPTLAWVSTPTVGAWTQITGTIDLSACTTVNKLQLFVGADTGNLYIDDVTLVAQ
jgi:hypothetical protein